MCSHADYWGLTKNTMHQLPLSLAQPATYSPENFFVSDANAQAHEWIRRWPEWPAHALVLTGPKGAGKTHLAHLWRARSQGEFHEAKTLQGDPLELLGPQRAAAVENIEHLADEKTLFHLLNAAREEKGFLLLTSALAPGEWKFALPDLRSRLLALPAAAMGAPDDALLSALLTKQFADRQLSPPKELIAWLAPRMERSFESAASLVERLDSLAMREQKPLSIALARRLLEPAS